MRVCLTRLLPVAVQERQHAALQHAALQAQTEHSEQEQRRQAEELRARGHEALQQEVSRLQQDHKQSLLTAQTQSTQVGLLHDQTQNTQVGLLRPSAHRYACCTPEHTGRPAETQSTQVGLLHAETQKQQVRACVCLCVIEQVILAKISSGTLLGRFIALLFLAQFCARG